MVGTMVLLIPLSLEAEILVFKGKDPEREEQECNSFSRKSEPFNVARIYLPNFDQLRVADYLMRAISMICKGGKCLSNYLGIQ